MKEPQKVSPIFAVIGTTGVGKSQFAIELAKAFNGEVINADALQVYKGMDIATNKVTEDEMQGIPHHLMSFVSPHDEYSVVNFVQDARIKIQEIQSRNKIPIVVGGTNYYIQSLLWQDTVLPTDVQVDGNQELRTKIQSALDAFDENSSASEDVSELRHLLFQVDPTMAERWNPKDSRKIRRSLQVFATTGKLHSQYILEQEEKRSESTENGIPRLENLFPVRYPSSAIFWLHSETGALDKRLDSRVDVMVERGLLDELMELRRSLLRSNPDLDFTRGLLQAIGLKEFSPFFTTIDSVADEVASSDLTSEQQKILKECVDKMKLVTRRYARKQISWIKRKLGPQCYLPQLPNDVTDNEKLNGYRKRSGVSLFALDATDIAPDVWRKNVLAPGIQIASRFTSEIQDDEENFLIPVSCFPKELRGLLDEIHLKQQRSIEEHLQELDPKSSDNFKSKTNDRWMTYNCDICSTSHHGNVEWHEHLNSKRHRQKIKLMQSPEWEYYQRAKKLKSNDPIAAKDE